MTFPNFEAKAKIARWYPSLSHTCQLSEPYGVVGRFANFLPGPLSGLESGHPGRNLPLYCPTLKTTPALCSTSLQNYFATPLLLLSLPSGCFSTGLKASSAAAVQSKKSKYGSTNFLFVFDKQTWNFALALLLLFWRDFPKFKVSCKGAKIMFVHSK